MLHFIVYVLAFSFFFFIFFPVSHWHLQNHLIWRQILENWMMICSVMKDNYLITQGENLLSSFIHLWLILKVIYWKVLTETRNQSAGAAPWPSAGFQTSRGMLKVLISAYPNGQEALWKQIETSPNSKPVLTYPTHGELSCPPVRGSSHGQFLLWFCREKDFVLSHKHFCEYQTPWIVVS